MLLVNCTKTDFTSELFIERVCQWSFHWRNGLVNSLLANRSSERPIEFVSEMFIDNVCQWTLHRQCLPIKLPVILFTSKLSIDGVRHSVVHWRCLPVNYLLTFASELPVENRHMNSSLRVFFIKLSTYSLIISVVSISCVMLLFQAQDVKLQDF